MFPLYPLGEPAGDKLDDDLDFSVHHLSNVNSIATRASWTSKKRTIKKKFSGR
jgi:hypothetical protein